MDNRPPLVERKTLSRKVVGAVGVGSAVATVLTWLLHVWQPDLPVPDEVVLAVGTLVAVGVGGWSFTEREDA